MARSAARQQSGNSANLGFEAQLQSAAADFARAEIARIVEAVIADLRERPAEEIFADVAARHLWDEYCWALQEGPFDNDMVGHNVNLGSLSSAFDDVVRGSIEKEVENLPRYAQVFLSVHTFEQDADSIIDTIRQEIMDRAAQRQLDLIGPDRADAIAYYIEDTGFVWTTLSESGPALDLVGGYADTMTDPDADLSQLAEEMAEAFMLAAGDEVEEYEAFMLAAGDEVVEYEAEEDLKKLIVLDLLRRFKSEIQFLLIEKDILPSLQAMRDALIRRLDK